MTNQVIPAEAVEAAAEAYFENCDYAEWEFLAEGVRTAIRADLRAALEAAAPHMLAGAWDEGGCAAIEREHAYGVEEKALFSNPYGSKS